MSILTTAFRLSVAVICGGVIGLNRGRRHRPAGFRTHMLACLGAALTMLIGEYLFEFLSEGGYNITTDVSRFGAQVINGIGFLGAGTIIVTDRQEIEGLTTAAGLWASACMGLAIGAGFYFGAILGCALIYISMTIMKYIESFVVTRARNMNIYVELTDIDDVGLVIEKIKANGIRIYDVELHKANKHTGAYASAVFMLHLPKRQPHSQIMGAIASVKSIRALEEI